MAPASSFLGTASGWCRAPGTLPSNVSVPDADVTVGTPLCERVHKGKRRRSGRCAITNAFIQRHLPKEQK